MRATLLLFAFAAIFNMTAFAQVGTELEKGDDAFYSLDYDQALYFYEIANEQQPNDPAITRRIGKLYRRIGLPNISAEWYKKTIENGSQEPEDILYYAEALKSLGQYDAAVLWYGKYAEKVPNDSRAISHIRDTNYYLELFADSAKYAIKRLEINNSDPVIGVTMMNKSTYLISAVNIGSSIDSDKNEVSAFLDIYEVKVDENFEFQNPKALGTNVNSKYHDGPVFYSPWDQSIFITRNNIKKNKAVIDETGNVNTKIYQSLYAENEWGPVIDLPFNDDAFSNAHACVSVDGQTLFFVSNRPGGYGGTDLYSCTKTDTGWGEPKNLGPAVNTEGNEMFPFLSSIGTLYFASDGHAGLGGLDIFFSEEYNGTYLSPLNMGAPINTNSDDFSLLYDDTADRGYFCSNRTGRGNDDIFFFQFRTLQQLMIAGKVEFEDKNITAHNENIYIHYKDSERVDEVRLDENGAFQIIGLPDEKFYITMKESELYTSPAPLFEYQVPSSINDSYVSLGTKFLTLKEPLVHSGPIGEYKAQSNPDQTTQNVVAENNSLADSNDESINKLLEEADQLFFKQEYYKAQSMYQQVLDLEASNGYALSRLKEIESILSKQQNQNTFANATSVVDLAQLKIENILFDFNKTIIREEDKAKLNQLASILLNDPTTKIFVKAFCDSRGSKQYNENLSMNRAMAIKGYLIKKGITKERIELEWFGEEKLVNGCSDNVPCTKEQHAVNRRAEFKITRK